MLRLRVINARFRNRGIKSLDPVINWIISIAISG